MRSAEYPRTTPASTITPRFNADQNSRRYQPTFVFERNGISEVQEVAGLRLLWSRYQDIEMNRPELTRKKLIAPNTERRDRSLFVQQVRGTECTALPATIFSSSIATHVANLSRELPLQMRAAGSRGAASPDELPSSELPQAMTEGAATRSAARAACNSNPVAL